MFLLKSRKVSISCLFLFFLWGKKGKSYGKSGANSRKKKTGETNHAGILTPPLHVTGILRAVGNMNLICGHFQAIFSISLRQFHRRLPNRGEILTICFGMGGEKQTD